jgi:hypothetical protein
VRRGRDKEKPAAGTHWSTRDVSKKMKLSQTTVSRI